MSNPGYAQGFFSPEEVATEQGLRRRQAYAQALLQGDMPSGQYGGLAAAGNKLLGAFLSNKADKQEQELAGSSQDRYSRDMAAFLKGDAPAAPQTATSSQAPSVPSPQISNAAGPDMPRDESGMAQGGQMMPQPIPNAQGPSPMPQAMPNAQGQAPAPAPLQMAQSAQQSPMDRLLATHNPALIQQFAPQLFTHQMDVNDRKVIPLTDQEAIAAGLRPGGVYGREAATGNLTTIQPSDMKSQGAFNQGIQEHQAEQVLSSQALAQKIQLEKLQQGPQWAALNKPVSIGMGESLVNPKTGQVIYTGAPDADAVQTGIDFFKKFGTFPPNARSPALQQAIMAGIRKQGVSMDDAANSRIGFHAQQGAASSVAKTNAQTAVNEGTVNNSINIVRKLLPIAASRGQFTDINNLTQNLGRRTNDTNAVLLKNGIDSISGEYARVMTGSTSGSPSSDSARHEAAQRILYGYNNGTIDAVMNQMQQEMAGRSGSQSSILGNLTGGNYTGTPVPGAAQAPSNGQSRFKIEQVH